LLGFGGHGHPPSHVHSFLTIIPGDAAPFVPSIRSSARRGREEQACRRKASGPFRIEAIILASFVLLLFVQEQALQRMHGEPSINT
jgi:hypothetical protein